MPMALDADWMVTDREHHCFTSGNIPKVEGGQIHLIFVTTYDLHENKLTQKEALLEQKYFTGSIPLLTPRHNPKTCSGPEAFSSTTIFKKCGGKTRVV